MYVFNDNYILTMQLVDFLNYKNILTKLMCCILCLYISSICEDVIHLKHGGRLKGEIVKATKANVLINFGFGDMEVDSSEIAKIVWGDRIGRESLIRNWEGNKVITEQKNESVFESKFEPEIKQNFEVVTEPKAEPKVELKIDPLAEPKIEIQEKPKVESKVDSLVETKGESKERFNGELLTEKMIRKYNMKKSTSFPGMAAKGGIFAIGEATRNQDLLEASGISKNAYPTIPKSAPIGVYYPRQFTVGKKYPLLLVMGPGLDIGITEINSYVQFSNDQNIILAAPELPAEEDSKESRFYYTAHLIEYFTEEGIIDGKCVWIGGISKGAQWALQLGALGGDLFKGVIAIGGSEDFSVILDGELHNRTLLGVPICLLNRKGVEAKKSDEVLVNKTIASFINKGFSNLKVIEYTGQEAIPTKETTEAFGWLRSAVKK